MSQEMALVYEQNGQLAQQVRKTIQRADYRVRTTSDEGRFWKTYCAEGADLVLVDLPDSRGREECRDILRRLRSADPDVRVVLVAGSYAAASGCLVGDDLANPLVEVVVRPLQRGELALRVARLKRYGANLAGRRTSSGSIGSSGVAAGHVVGDLHDPDSGRIDAKRVSEFLGLSVAELGRLIGRSRAALHKTSAAPAIQAKLEPLAGISASLLRLVGSPEAARIWLNSPNPELGGATPMGIVRDGGARTVDELLRDALLGQPV